MKFKIWFNIFLPFLFFAIILASCSNKNQIKIDSIVCFGDSLTRGYGSSDGQTYPYYLQQLVNIPVINKGVDGDTAKDGLDRIEDILQFNNSLIIVEFGANDFFKRVPISETKKNIKTMIKKLKVQNNIIVLVSTQDFFLRDIYKILKNFAEEKDLLFIDGILNEIWKDRSLFYDNVHPNSKGYKIIADKIYDNIKNLL